MRQNTISGMPDLSILCLTVQPRSGQPSGPLRPPNSTCSCKVDVLLPYLSYVSIIVVTCICTTFTKNLALDSVTVSVAKVCSSIECTAVRIETSRTRGVKSSPLKVFVCVRTCILKSCSQMFEHLCLVFKQDFMRCLRNGNIIQLTVSFARM